MPALSAKYSKFTVFAFWYMNRLIADEILDETQREKAFASLKLLASVDEQVPIYEEFLENTKETAKNMKAYITSLTKPKKETKPKKAIKKTNLVDGIVTDVLNSIMEPRTDEAPEPAPKKRGGGRKKAVVEKKPEETQETSEKAEEKPKKKTGGKKKAVVEEKPEEITTLTSQPADLECVLNEDNDSIVSVDIEGETIEYEGKEYLKDMDDNIYTMEQVFVGKIKGDAIEFF